MSNVKTNKFGGALLFILGEFAAADAEMIEDGGMEVFGEDDQGREGSCEVSINDLAQAASHEINHLTEQLAKANGRVRELEAQTFDVIAAQSIDRAYQIASAFPKDKAILEALSSVKEGATNRLNKFAIEKKLKVLDDLLEEIQCSAVVPKRYEQFQESYLEGIKHCIQFIECQSKQLRKEQNQ